MKLAGSLLVIALAASSFGCKFFEKKVPEDIVRKAINTSLRHMPNTGAALCGAKTKGLIDADVTIKSRGEKNTGLAHVKGSPWPTAGEDLPKKCEGDVEFQFTFTSKTKKVGKKKTTETTWFLEKLKLVAVQTDGVKFKGEQEETSDPSDEEEADEEEKPVEKATKKKKSADDE